MIDQKAKDEYLESDGQMCPHCLQKHTMTNIFAASTDVRVMYHYHSCPVCNGKWREVYRLVDILDGAEVLPDCEVYRCDEDKS